MEYPHQPYQQSFKLTNAFGENRKFGVDITNREEAIKYPTNSLLQNVRKNEACEEKPKYFNSLANKTLRNNYLQNHLKKQRDNSKDLSKRGTSLSRLDDKENLGENSRYRYRPSKTSAIIGEKPISVSKMVPRWVKGKKSQKDETGMAIEEADQEESRMSEELNNEQINSSNLNSKFLFKNFGNLTLGSQPQKNPNVFAGYDFGPSSLINQDKLPKKPVGWNLPSVDQQNLADIIFEAGSGFGSYDNIEISKIWNYLIKMKVSIIHN